MHLNLTEFVSLDAFHHTKSLKVDTMYKEIKSLWNFIEHLVLVEIEKCERVMESNQKKYMNPKVSCSCLLREISFNIW